MLGRCDASQSEKAAITVAKDNLVLTLCGHHWGRFEATLIGSGWYVLEDNRELASAGRVVAAVGEETN